MSEHKKGTWLTAQECIGLPGFPSGVSNIRNRLEKLAANNPNGRRKRAGSKAYEYNVSLLPEYIRQYLDADAVEPQPEKIEATLADDDNETLWRLIFKRMPYEQQQAAIDIFIEGGIKMLMPLVVELAKTEAHERREILRQRNSVESNQPAEQNYPQMKNKAG
ncbi:MAG: hypothetical protein [Caudoviricetes sp.]|nr:MAG: hypothetical protein [Caudoviricetes sp.]